MADNTSPANELNKTDWAKIAITAGIAAASAGISALIDNLANLNMGAYTVLLVPVIHSGLTTLLKYLKDNTK